MAEEVGVAGSRTHDVVPLGGSGSVRVLVAFDRSTLAALEAADEPPSTSDLLLRSVDDVVVWASRDQRFATERTITVWHLGTAGQITCLFPACGCCSLKEWARHPYDLRRSRSEGLRAGGCGTDRLIIDTRPKGERRFAPVNEGDARSFRRIRRTCERLGVNLIHVSLVALAIPTG